MSSTSAPPHQSAPNELPLASTPKIGAVVRSLEPTALAAVVLIGATLRLWLLGRDDFWTDEMATIQYASSLTTTYRDTHPPLYYLLMYTWLLAVPANEVSLRLPSVIMGIASIVFIYRFAAALFDRPTGLFSAILLALSPMQIHYSQEARMYALLTLSALLSSWSLLGFMRHPTMSRAILYLISTTVLAYSHLFGLVIICTQNVVFLYVGLFVRRPSRRILIVWTLMQTVIVYAILPWLAYLYSNPGIERVNWIPPATLPDLLEVLEEFAFNSTGMLALLSALALLGTVSLAWRSGRVHISVGDRLTVPFLVILCVAPIILAFALSNAVMPILISRYLIACTIPLYILAARGVTRLRPGLLRWGAIVAVLVLAASSVHERVQAPHKLPWQEVAQTVAPRVLDTDLLVFEGFSSDAFDYYAERHQVLTGIERFWIRPDGRAVPSDAQARLSQAIVGRERFWLIQGGSRENEQYFNQYVRRTFDLADDLTFPGVRARLFRVRR